MPKDRIKMQEAWRLDRERRKKETPAVLEKEIETPETEAKEPSVSVEDMGDIDNG